MEPSKILRVFIISCLFWGDVFSFYKRDLVSEDGTEESHTLSKSEEIENVIFDIKSDENKDENENDISILDIIPISSDESTPNEIPYDIIPIYSDESIPNEVPYDILSSDSETNDISNEFTNEIDNSAAVDESSLGGLSESEELTNEIEPQVSDIIVNDILSSDSETNDISNEFTNESDDSAAVDESSLGGLSESEEVSEYYEDSASIQNFDDEDYVIDIFGFSGSGSGSGFGSGDGSFEKSEENDEPLKVMCTHTNSEIRPWWRVDLLSTYIVQKVVIFNRAQGFNYRLHDISVRVGMSDIRLYSSIYSMFTDNEECMLRKGVLPPGENVIECHQPIEGRYVSIQIVEGYFNTLTLCEVEVYVNDTESVKNIALKKPTLQSSVSYQGIPERATDGIVAAQFYAGEVHMSCINTDEYYFDTSKMDPLPSDCAEIYIQGRRRSGVYTIYPKGWLNAQPFQVFCDMDKDGGGWTSILRRHYYLDHSESFHRFLTDYIDGFGELCEEFWLGLKHLHVLTTQNSVQLKVYIHNSYGEDSYAQYEKFLVFDNQQNYKSFVFGYSGTAGDYLKSDVEFKLRSSEGGWWWHKYDEEPHTFLGSNPNGDLWYGRNVSDPITWGCQECQQSRENYYIQFFDMKIRPSWFQYFISYGRTIYG